MIIYDVCITIVLSYYGIDLSFLISCLWTLASCIWIWFDIHENSSTLIYQNTPNFLRKSSFEESHAQNGFFDFHYAMNLVSLFFYRYETHFLLQGQPRQIFVVPKISVSKKTADSAFVQVSSKIVSATSLSH